MTSPLPAPSFWLETCGEPLLPRPGLPGNTDADVAIVGAGYTGLWTAYHLLEYDPALRIVLLEKDIAGWGASGRNGGWCSALFAASWSRLAREHGIGPARSMRQALENTVDEIGDICARHEIDAHYVRGGTLTVARTPAQVTRLRADAEEHRTFLPGVQWLDGPAADARVRVAGALAATFDPHCAALHPARLVRGLARVVEARGARLAERTEVVEIGNGRVVTAAGTVRAPVIIRATEGYTADLKGFHRQLAPIWSLVIATDPVPPDIWEQLGWSARETVTDERHLLIYAQRTADDRIVFGGRGAPYRFGSRTAGDRGHAATFGHLATELRTMFPALADVRVTHRWGGVLGVPRDWMPSVVFDRSTGLGWAGGYVGDGVGCAALAGRTLADLILGHDTDRTRLPWVGHRWRSWEPEPLRWAGVRAMNAVMASADRAEDRSGRPARRAALAGRLLGG